jgi:hypothetical protein
VTGRSGGVVEEVAEADELLGRERRLVVAERPVELAVGGDLVGVGGRQAARADAGTEDRVLHGELLAGGVDGVQRVGEACGARGPHLAQHGAVEDVEARDHLAVAVEDLPGPDARVVGDVGPQVLQLADLHLGLRERGEARGLEPLGALQRGEHLLGLGFALVEADLEDAAVALALTRHEQRGLVPLLADGVGGARHPLPYLEQLGALPELGSHPRLVGDPQDAEDQSEQCGNYPDNHKLDGQRPVARVQPLGPGLPGLGAGHVNVPLWIAGDDLPHSGTHTQLFASAGRTSCGPWSVGGRVRA